MLKVKNISMLVTVPMNKYLLLLGTLQGLPKGILHLFHTIF